MLDPIVPFLIDLRGERRQVHRCMPPLETGPLIGLSRWAFVASQFTRHAGSATIPCEHRRIRRRRDQLATRGGPSEAD